MISKVKAIVKVHGQVVVMKIGDIVFQSAAHKLGNKLSNKIKYIDSLPTFIVALKTSF